VISVSRSGMVEWGQGGDRSYTQWWDDPAEAGKDTGRSAWRA
jgi:hypothetical protein